MINVNGKNYSGRSITITNGKVIIDGNNVTPDGKEIKIAVQGDIDILEVDVCETVYVEGTVGQIKTSTGDVKVKGNIVAGNVKTMSGDITCLNVSGDVKTMSGDIKHNKKARPSRPEGHYTYD